jgi:quercetin dioxygenase-like cupin family protein
VDKSKQAADSITPAEIVTIQNLVDYQEGAIVSRTIVSKATGTVTLFAFDKGQALSEHSTPFDALVCGLDGTVEVTISGKVFRVERGQALVMPANEPHAVRAPERFKMMLVMIKS